MDEHWRGRGFTIIELLVVVAVISLILSILAPCVVQVRLRVRQLLGAARQRESVQGVTLYAADNDDEYPESIATVGLGANWNWQEPMMLTGYRRINRRYRSMSAYLAGYIEAADVMYCPGGPREYPYLQDAWDAGDAWDNPETPQGEDPVSGTYCFYWDYTGYLVERDKPFQGPRTIAGARGESTLMVTDYFGYGHHRSPYAFGSCERFSGADVTPGTVLSSAYWSRPQTFEYQRESVQIGLNAGYTDGHVETYTSADVETMKVIRDRRTGEPYPEGLGPGDFYLPRKAIR
ncbi:MAG TPA: type II secretion system protein [Anaerohalosphaeraceae bacterium]|nr:type II secretion system protein [Anaerohalosphaeraceae bacterium]HRT49836.1 type II secretion system protein [Anaerohalosphaeraceae bacterium]HRT87055.1 type II secretion system protein [Anaerohalosphaeraceae bacterium]